MRCRCNTALATTPGQTGNGRSRTARDEQSRAVRVSERGGRRRSVSLPPQPATRVRSSTRHPRCTSRGRARGSSPRTPAGRRAASADLDQFDCGDVDRHAAAGREALLARGLEGVRDQRLVALHDRELGGGAAHVAMPRVTASGRVRSAMKDIVAGLGDWLSSSSSCPRPPRNMPLAAAVVRKARRCPSAAPPARSPPPASTKCCGARTARSRRRRARSLRSRR